MVLRLLRFGRLDRHQRDDAFSVQSGIKLCRREIEMSGLVRSRNVLFAPEESDVHVNLSMPAGVASWWVS
jgi:hypothetical protein